MAGVHELAVVAGQRFEALVGRFDEDIRFVSGAAKDALDAEDLVADRIAVAEGGQNLVNPDHARLRMSRGARGLDRRSEGASVCSTSSAGAHILAAAREPARQRVGCARRRFLLQPLEHVEILPLDHRPVVLFAIKPASVAAERAAEPAVVLDGAQCFGEFRERSRSTDLRCCECIAL